MVQLLTKYFRANPNYELLVSNGIISTHCIPLESDTESLYGYLRPRVSGASLPSRQVSPVTALLFLALQHGALIPEYYYSLFGQGIERFLLRLVLDEVLEIEHLGQFITGNVASKHLLGDTIYSPKGRIAELSIDALKYADALGKLPVSELTKRIYDFGRLPISAMLKRTFYHPDKNGFSSILNDAGDVLNAHWVRSVAFNAHWVMWRPIRIFSESENVRCKLYISPGLSDAAEAFKISANILGQSAGVCGLKIGRDLAGLTRSDRIVAYFSRLDDLQQVGLRLQQELTGCVAQGVPFTAALSDDGLLSWGADPPHTDTRSRGSWRLWLASKLANQFEVLRGSNALGATWPFVLDRIRLDGINPETWVPDANLWSSRSVIP